MTFTGHGSDADGTVVAYRWLSSLDGEVGTTASFTTSSLSVRGHAISFGVQDNNGAWSENVTGSVTITEAEDTTPPSTPVLISPVDGATLPQPNEEWSFDWSDSSDSESGIAEYQLYVIRQGAGTPAINVSVTNSEYLGTVGGQITHEYLDNWTWKVRAQNNAGLWSPWSDTRTFSVEPKIIETTVTLTSISSEGGQVRSNGGVLNGVPNVGDTPDNLGAQAFFSFDISGIPANAEIIEVVANFTDYDILGDPFGSPLGDGCLRAYLHYYGTLGPEDYRTGTPLGAIIRWCSTEELDTPQSNSDVASALQGKVGNTRFPLRLQFKPPQSDNDGVSDMVRFGPAKLIVTYSYVL